MELKAAINVKEVLKKARKKALRLAKEDIVAFIENFVYFEDKDKGEVVLFKFWDEQKEAIISIDKNKKTVILKARQLGFSWLVVAYAVCKMIAYPGYRVIILSQGEKEAKELIRRAGTVILPRMSFLIGEGGIAKINPTTEKVEITHHDGQVSVMEAFATSGAGGRGFSGDLLIFDEWGTHAQADSTYAAAYPTINRKNGGKFVGLSTMNRGTLFEDVVVNYEEKGFNRIFIPWYADPSRDEKWYNETVNAIGIDKTLQEYPATVEEALTIPGGAFFPEFDTRVHVVTPMEESERKRLIYYQSIDYGLDMLSIRWISVDERGKCRVFREFDCPDLIISEAAREIRRYWESDGKPKAVFAPPDMWNRETGSGRSRADQFLENGVVLLKSSNDIAAGCAALKELLYHEDGKSPRLVFDRDCTAKCVYDLTKIQKDKKRPDIYAKDPHYLTHGVDALRYFAVMYIERTPEEAVPNPAVLHYWQQRRYRGR
ncbi:MAG: hypothetical protein ACI3XA_04675 [Clostridia bacterium]